jgi:hypothetical protein
MAEVISKALECGLITSEAVSEQFSHIFRLSSGGLKLELETSAKILNLFGDSLKFYHLFNLLTAQGIITVSLDVLYFDRQTFLFVLLR